MKPYRAAGIGQSDEPKVALHNALLDLLSFIPSRAFNFSDISLNTVSPEPDCFQVVAFLTYDVPDEVTE